MVTGSGMFGQVAPDQSNKSKKPPNPSIVVSMEKKEIREKERLKVTLWISNNSWQDLTGVKLFISAPVYLKWYKNDNDDALSIPLEVKTIPAQSVIHRPVWIELVPDQAVKEFNILFVLEYSWENKQSFVAVEKSLKIDYLGFDRVMGLPLTIIGFFLPGFVFLLMLKLLGVDYYRKLEKEITLVLSVIVSVVILLIGYLLKLLINWSWLRFFSFDFKISSGKLVVLITSGAALGLVVGTTYIVYHTSKMHRQRKNELKEGDANSILIKKILTLNPGYDGSTASIYVDGAEYLGAHYAETKDEVFLLGSFQVNRQELPAEIIEKLEKKECIDENGELVQTKKKILEVIRMVERLPGVPIEVRCPIHRNVNDNWEYKEKMVLVWKKEQLTSRPHLKNGIYGHDKRRLLELAG
jgi:hypothetical protein